MTVRKLGAPGHQELAIGAVAPNDVLVLNQHLIRDMGVDESQLQEIIRRETAELNRRLHFFRGRRPFPSLQDQTILLVDDGLATGASAMASIRAARIMGAQRIVLAVPVGAHSTVSVLGREVDELVCLETPEFFDAVSHWYVNFPQVSDAEVIRLLEASWGNDLGDITVKARSIGPP
jgi:putative phosphoribosyl transferase